MPQTTQVYPMSRTIIELSTSVPSPIGRSVPIIHYGGDSEIIVASGTSQSTDATTEDAMNGVVSVQATTGAVWVDFGKAAVVGSGKYVGASQRREFGGVPKGTTVSVILDS